MDQSLRRLAISGGCLVACVSPIVNRLRDLLTEPELVGIAPDSSEFTTAHRAILERKRFVRSLFDSFYARCRAADNAYFDRCQTSIRLELGSGAGMLKQLLPDVITSDVKELPYVDLVARGEELPFANASLRAIYAMNVFHHVSDARAFFREMTRVLAPSGGLVMIEPYYGPLARILFQYLFTMESYDIAQAEWPRHGRTEVASAANQALSYIVLRRDRTTWEHEFPHLELVEDQPHTHASYLASGGLNFRQLVPRSVGDLLIGIEQRLDFLNPLLALQHTLVIRRR